MVVQDGRLALQASVAMVSVLGCTSGGVCSVSKARGSCPNLLAIDVMAAAAVHFSKGAASLDCLDSYTIAHSVDIDQRTHHARDKSLEASLSHCWSPLATLRASAAP